MEGLATRANELEARNLELVQSNYNDQKANQDTITHQEQMIGDKDAAIASYKDQNEKLFATITKAQKIILSLTETKKQLADAQKEIAALKGG